MRDKDRIEYEELEDYIDSLQHRCMKSEDRCKKLEELVKLLREENRRLKAYIKNYEEEKERELDKFYDDRDRE